MENDTERTVILILEGLLLIAFIRKKKLPIHGDCQRLFAGPA